MKIGGWGSGEVEKSRGVWERCACERGEEQVGATGRGCSGSCPMDGTNTRAANSAATDLAADPGEGRAAHRPPLPTIDQV